MAKTKVMNEGAFSKRVKEFDALGELIRARQGEKQSILDSFDAEKKRFSAGKISEKTLISSVRKTNKELIRLDKSIRLTIQKAVKLGGIMNKFLRSQTPKVIRAQKTGLSTSSGKKKKAPKRKAAKRNVSKRKAPAKKEAVVKPKITGKQVKVEVKAEKKFIKKQKKALVKK